MAEPKQTTQNFDIPKGMDIQEYIKSEIAKSEAKTKASFLKSKTNSIQLGATVIDKDMREGNEIIDKSTGLPAIDTATGETKRYPNKYYVTFAFKGGQIKQEVKPADYQKLEQNKDYFCMGYLGEVKNFGNTETLPIFNDFSLIEY